MPRKTQSSSNNVAAKASRTRKNVVRTAAGAIPLAIAALVGTSVLPSGGGASEAAVTHGAAAVKCESNIEDFNSCHTDYPTGCSAGGKYDAYLNLLKNQVLRAPTSGNVTFLSENDYQNLEASLPQGLARSNHGDFADALARSGEEQMRGVVAYLYYAKPTGSESSNCQLTGPDDVDFHIGVGFDAQLASRLRDGKLSAADRKALTQTSVIVEMTPHTRAYFQPGWTIDALKAAIGKPVKVIGQLIVDNEHNVPGQNCAFKANAPASCWRASVWELHPVTDFYTCENANNDCAVDSPDWVELGESSTPGTRVASSKKDGHNKP